MPLIYFLPNLMAVSDMHCYLLLLLLIQVLLPCGRYIYIIQVGGLDVYRDLWTGSREGLIKAEEFLRSLCYYI